MKKLIKSLCLTAMALCIGFAFVACGEKAGTKYNFSDITFEGETSMESTMKNVFETMYKGSVAEITDKKIKIKMNDNTGEMDYTKSEKKYVLSGSLVKQMQDTVNAAGVSGMKVDFYGIDTEKGFSMVLIESYNDQILIEVHINFVKE